MPGFIKNYDKVKAKGYEVIACVTVNDPFVTGAWGKSAQAGSKVRILADPSAEFTKVIILILFFMSYNIDFSNLKGYPYG